MREMHLSGLCSSVCLLVFNSNLINQQRWDAATTTLKTTEVTRSRLDRRAKLASLVGIYVDADDQGGGRSYGVDAIVAVQPDRSSGRKLIFIDGKTEELLGFVLLETSNAPAGHANNKSRDESQQESENAAISTIRGIEVEGWARGRGYSTLFIGVWLKLCLQGNIVPATVSINKPLLALALCRFGFTPTVPQREVEESTTTNKRKRRSVRKTPISIEISRENTPGEKVEIYCEDDNFFDLQAGFKAGELKHQNLALTRSPPCPRGERIQIRTSYVAPESYDDDALLCGLRLDALQGECTSAPCTSTPRSLTCNDTLRQKASRTALIGRLPGFSRS